MLEQNRDREKLDDATSFITNIPALLHGPCDTITSHEPQKKKFLVRLCHVFVVGGGPFKNHLFNSTDYFINFKEVVRQEVVLTADGV